MKAIKRAALLLLCGALIAPAAFASESKKKISYVVDSGEITIQGTNAASGSKVTIEILYPGKTDADAIGAVRWLGECVADADGNWEKNFVMDADSGIYPVRIYVSGEDEIYKENLEFVSYLQFERIIEKINSEPEKLGEIIEENKDIIGIDSKAYSAIKSDGALHSAMFDECKKSVPFKDIYSFREVVKLNSTMAAFNNVKDKTVLSGVIDDSADVLGLTDEKIFKNWQKISAEDKANSCDRMKKSGYENAEDIKNDFTETAILQELLNISEWNMTEPTAKSYADSYKDKIKALGNIDFSAYELLSGERRYQAMTELKKTDVKSLTDWADKFNAVCKKWKTEKLPTTSTGGSGGSSGGSGSGGKKSTGVGGVSAVIQDNIQKNDDKTDGEIKFRDLENAPWAKTAVTELAKLGVVSGRSEEYFDTQANVTREEFIKMLTSALKLVEDKNYSVDFTDTDSGAWYYKYVACAAEKGITSGLGDGSFGVGRAITREEIAAMLARSAQIAGIKLEEKTADADFADYDEISDWAKDACKTLKKSGIVSGMEDGRFAPHENATRAQAAVMIYNMLCL